MASCKPYDIPTMPFEDFCCKDEKDTKSRKIVYGCEKTHSVDPESFRKQHFAYEKQQKLYQEREAKRRNTTEQAGDTE